MIDDVKKEAFDVDDQQMAEICYYYKKCKELPNDKIRILITMLDSVVQKRYEEQRLNSNNMSPQRCGGNI